MSDKTIINIHGLDIKENSLYKIEPKLDKSAPDGFIKEGTTKLMSEGIGNSISCRYVDRGNGKGNYDTGFYKQSPCYEGFDTNEVTAKIKSLTKHIVEPFEKLSGGDKTQMLDNTNLEFWDSYSVDLYEGRVFNTANVEDLLDLYIATLSYDLTPASKIGNPSFSQSDYMIKDASQSMSISNQRELARMSAVGAFMGMLSTNPSDLEAILKYLDITRAQIKSEPKDMQIAFSIWLDKDVQNPDLFNLAYAKAAKPEGLDEIMLVVIVKKLIANGKIKREGGEYLYQGIPVGIDSRSITHNLSTKEDLAETADKIRMEK